MKEAKKMDIKEFRELGVLQEVNRQFLHPLGLALEVEINEDETERLGGVWDYRDDPEGMVFGRDMISEEKIDSVEQLRESKRKTREKMFRGAIVQPPQRAIDEIITYCNKTKCMEECPYGMLCDLLKATMSVTPDEMNEEQAKKANTMLKTVERQLNSAKEKKERKGCVATKNTQKRRKTQ